MDLLVAGYWSFHTIVQLCCVIVKDHANLNVNQRLSEIIILQEVYHKISSTTCQLSQCDLIARQRPFEISERSPTIRQELPFKSRGRGTKKGTCF